MCKTFHYSFRMIFVSWKDIRWFFFRLCHNFQKQLLIGFPRTSCFRKARRFHRKILKLGLFYWGYRLPATELRFYTSILFPLHFTRPFWRTFFENNLRADASFFFNGKLTHFHQLLQFQKHRNVLFKDKNITLKITSSKQNKEPTIAVELF